MKRRFFTIALSALALAGLGAAPDAKSEVQTFAPFLGEWTIHGTWSDGRPLVAHNIYSWALNSSHLACQTWVGEGAEKHQRYQSMMSYDAKHECLTTYSFAVDGAVSAYRVETEDGKTFRFGFNPIGTEETNVRQTITFNSADEYRWIVEINANGTWTRIMDGTWKRDDPKPGAEK